WLAAIAAFVKDGYFAGARGWREPPDRSCAFENRQPAGEVARTSHRAISKSAAGRSCARVRKSRRIAQHSYARRGFRRRAADRSGFADGLYPDRRADQSWEF